MSTLEFVDVLLDAGALIREGDNCFAGEQIYAYMMANEHWNRVDRGVDAARSGHPV